MGQYYRLHAPRRRERVEWWGKLVEILFGGEVSNDIVSLLARPIIPVTMSNIANGSGERKAPRQRQASSSNRTRRSRRRNAPSSLLQLPTEIHSMIFKSLDFASVFCFGLTCERFWHMATPIFGQRLAMTLGTWADTPVACIGDETDIGADALYPHSFLVPRDLDELEQGYFLGEEVFPGHNATISELGPLNLYSIAEARYTCTKDHCYESYLEDFIQPLLEDIVRYPYPANMLAMAETKKSSFYPTDREWILRNLTTREYVRPEAVALDDTYIHGPFIDVIGYGEVILYKTSWSTDPSTSLRSPRMHKGAWAGHMFDIVPISHLDSGGPWRDISDQITLEIERIWRRELGEDWRSEALMLWRNANPTGPDV